MFEFPSYSKMNLFFVEKNIKRFWCPFQSSNLNHNDHVKVAARRAAAFDVINHKIADKRKTFVPNKKIYLISRRRFFKRENCLLRSP